MTDLNPVHLVEKIAEVFDGDDLPEVAKLIDKLEEFSEDIDNPPAVMIYNSKSGFKKFVLWTTQPLSDETKLIGRYEVQKSVLLRNGYYQTKIFQVEG